MAEMIWLGFWRIFSIIAMFLGPALMILPSVMALYFNSTLSMEDILRYFFIGTGLSAFSILENIGEEIAVRVTDVKLEIRNLREELNIFPQGLF